MVVRVPNQEIVIMVGLEVARVVLTARQAEHGERGGKEGTEEEHGRKLAGTAGRDKRRMEARPKFCVILSRRPGWHLDRPPSALPICAHLSPTPQNENASPVVPERRLLFGRGNVWKLQQLHWFAITFLGKKI